MCCIAENQKMFSKFLILLFIVRAATQGPTFYEDAAKGLQVKGVSTLYVKLDLCKMDKDCLSLDVNEIKLLITCEDGEEKFEQNPKKIKDHVYQFTIDPVPCLRPGIHVVLKNPEGSSIFPPKPVEATSMTATSPEEQNSSKAATTHSACIIVIVLLLMKLF